MQALDVMKSKLFLSHNSADKPFVNRLAKDLQNAGIRVWLDEAEMRVGDSLIERIADGIEAADYLGIVLSPRSVNSSWVQRELNIALSREINDRSIKVLPILFRAM